MTLLLQPAPETGLSRVGEIISSLPTLATSPSVRPAAAYAPIPLYTAALEHLGDQYTTLTAAAVRYGWRYLVDEGGDLTTVDVFDRDGLFLASRDEWAKTFAQATVDAEVGADPQVDYDVRSFTIAAIDVQFLWLHNEDGGSLYIDLNDEQPCLRLLADIEGILRERARARLAEIVDAT